jgi:hypothetical protein
MSTEQSLLQQLNILVNSATVIVGIGNILKGDDRAGPLICEQALSFLCLTSNRAFESSD